MPAAYTITHYARDLRSIAKTSHDENEIFERLSPLAVRLSAETDWIEDRFYQPDPKTGFSAYLLHEERDHSLAVFAVSWAPGLGVGPHDHGTWALVVGVEGIERNTRYKRLDDRSTPEYAELEIKSESIAGPGELVCIRDGGIHAVHNDSDAVTMSLHSYGKHTNFTQRSQYDIDARTASDFKVDIQ